MVASTATGSPTIAASTSTPPMTIAVAIAATGSNRMASTYQPGLTRKLKTRRRSSRTPRPTLGEGSRDECRAGQCKGVEEDERSNAGQVEIDDPDAGKGQQRHGEDRRAGPVGDCEEDGKWMPSGDGAHLLVSFWAIPAAGPVTDVPRTASR